MPDQDLAASFVLWLFGSFFAGGLVGVAIGRFTRFEIGLGVGLPVPAVVSLSFAAAFATAYLAFRDAPDRTEGRVVAGAGATSGGGWDRGDRGELRRVVVRALVAEAGGG